MKIIIVDKIPLLKMCREFFGLEFGPIAYDELIDTLCLGIRGDSSDRTHIRDMAYRDMWLQGHHERFSTDQKMRLFRFFLRMRGFILTQIHQNGRIPYHLHLRYRQDDATRMSIKFEVCE